MGAKPLGRHTVAEVRNDEDAVIAICNVTGLSSERVARVLGETFGATLVRNAFRNHWPWSARALANRTAAFARDYDLREELQAVLGSTRHLVTKRLRAAAGQQLLRNVFWDYWPEEEDPSSARRVELSAEEAPTEEIPTDTEDALADTEVLTAIEPRAPRPGTELSHRYVLREQIGQGGFGATWLAHDRVTDLDVVLKLPNIEDGDAIRNELRQAFRAVHPNICQAFPDRDDDTGRPFLVMQYGGEDLVQRLERTGNAPFPLTLAVHVLVSIADALDFLHDHLVLHLDVSPKNILIDEDDVVRLTDFGASSPARVHTTAEGQETRLATVLHSFSQCYAAPEMLFQNVGRSRSDQYALFVVFCSLLEGKPRSQIAAYQEFKPLAVLTETQNAIVRKALSPDPNDRFESCGEPARTIADELARVPGKVLLSDVAKLCDDFVRRVDREQRRISSATTRLGGAVKLGRGLERILQGVFLWLATTQGFEPLETLRKIDPHATSIDRTTAGNLVKAITSRAADGDLGQSTVSSLVSDMLSGKSSRVWALINARNDVVHGRRPAEGLLPDAIALAELLRAG